MVDEHPAPPVIPKEGVPPLPPEVWDSLPQVARDLILWQQRQIVYLTGRLGEAEAAVRLAEARAERAEARISVLEAEVKSLREKLDKNSRNSSKPPSTDRPGQKKAKKRRKKGGRKPGGQKGHKGVTRELVPVEDVAKVVAVKPNTCVNCGADVSDQLLDFPERHQVTEIPPVKPEVTEFQAYSAWCGNCDTVTKADLPEGVSRGWFGPRLMAVVVMLTGYFRLSKRMAQEALSVLFGVEMSTGSVSAIERTASEALAGPVAEAAQHVQEQSAANADETGWREAGKRAWLWVAVTASVMVFRVRCSRATAVAKELLGACFGGILTSDRWGAYNWLPTDRRQLCWAHLIRDFTAISERGGASGKIGEKLLAAAHAMFRLWHRVRDGTLGRAEFARRMEPVVRKVSRLLEEGKTCGHAKTQGTCVRLGKVEEAMWTFVKHEGIEPTNNVAERAIRHAVIWRKLCFGTASELGSRFVERMLTTIGTLQLQDRDVLQFLTDTLESHVRNQPAPSLLPCE